MELSKLIVKEAVFMNKTINAANAPAAVGPYCHAKLAGNTLYTSGQLGLDPVTGELAQGVEAQARQALENLGVILKEAGMDFQDVTTAQGRPVRDRGRGGEVIAPPHRKSTKGNAAGCARGIAFCVKKNQDGEMREKKIVTDLTRLRYGYFAQNEPWILGGYTPFFTCISPPNRV